MTRTLLVVPTAAGVGLARTCLGLVRALDRRGVNVAFVKPVAQPRADGGPDRSTALVAATTALRPAEPLPAAELEQQLGAGGLDVVLETIVAAWQPVHDRSDVVVVEALSPGPSRLYASGLNQALARALDADVLLVAGWPPAGTGGGEDRADHAARPGPDPAAGTVEGVAETLAITAAGYWSGEHARVVGCVVGGLPPDDPCPVTQLGEALAERGLGFRQPREVFLHLAQIEEQLALRLGGGHFDQAPVAQHVLVNLGADPMHCKGHQAHAHRGVEALDRLHETHIAFLHQVAHGQSITQVSACNVHNESQVR